MNRILWLSLILLMMAAFASAQPTPEKPPAIFEADMLTASGNAAFNFATEQTSGPVIADLTGDGLPEVIVTGRKDIWVLNYANHDPQAALFHWTEPSGGEDDYEFCSPVTVCHLSSDGYPWIVVGASKWVHHVGNQQVPPGACPYASEDGPNSHWTGDCYHWHSVIRAWKFSGTTALPGPTSGDLVDRRLTTPAAADADGDGNDELCFVGSESYGIIGRDFSDLFDFHPTMRYCVGVRFYKLGGSSWTEPQCLPVDDHIQETYLTDPDDDGSWTQVAQTVPAAGDLDGDGLPEFLTQCLWRVQRFSFTETGVAEDWSFEADNPVNVVIGGYEELPDNFYTAMPWDFQAYDRLRVPGPTLAHVDQTGALYAFLQTQYESDHTLSRIKGDGTYDDVRYRYFWYNEDCMNAELAFGDDCGNGTPRVFGTASYRVDPEQNRKVRTWRWQGSDLSRLPLQGGDGFFYQSGLNEYSPGDIHTPAVLQSQLGDSFTVDFMANRNSSNISELKFQRTDGTGSLTDQWAWSNTDMPGGPVQSAITATDLDGDGVMDYVLSAGYQSSAGEDRTHVWAFPSGLPYNPEKIEWSGYRNNPQHTGLYAQPVHGTQTVPSAVWKGRVVVTTTYNVPAGYTLTIQPGTVVEIAANASIFIDGTLTALGTPTDSIYFKRDGSGAWTRLNFRGNSVANLSHCVIHGGFEVLMTNCDASMMGCHIYDMNNGLSVSGMAPENLVCEGNLIENCASNGIVAASSCGEFTYNTVRNCGITGIEWIGDYSYGGVVQAPKFRANAITGNGLSSPSSAIAGGHFVSTAAWLECNWFEDNYPHQIRCQTAGNIVMNCGGIRHAANTLQSKSANLDCATPQTEGILMYIEGSYPALTNGHNSFVFDDGDGTYLRRYPSSGSIPISMNYFYPDRTLPSPTNYHFCPMDGFSAGLFRTTADDSCARSIGGLQGSSLVYQQAMQAEMDGNLAESQALYSSVVEDYPDSAEALWATRSLLRTGLENNGSPMLLHDSLAGIWDDESRPAALRHAARREAVWALVAGRHYQNAITELQAIMAQADEDSLWAAVATEIVTLAEETGGPSTQGIGADGETASQRIRAFHDRIRHLMGFKTDDEARAANTPMVQSEKLSRAYPNPFNSTVNIAFELEQDVQVRLEVFNLMGQKVATLANEPLKAGSHTFNWSGEAMSSGVYFYRLDAGKTIETQKLMLLK